MGERMVGGADRIPLSSYRGASILFLLLFYQVSANVPPNSKLLTSDVEGWQSSDGAVQYRFGFRPDLTVGIDIGNIRVWTLTRFEYIKNVKVSTEPYVADSASWLEFSNGAVKFINSTGGIRWRSNEDAPNATAVLTEAGNFQVVAPTGQVLWDTFWYPTDTLLENQSLNYATSPGKRDGYGALNAGGRFYLFLVADGGLGLFRRGPPCLGNSAAANSTLCGEGLYQYCSFKNGWSCDVDFPNTAINSSSSHELNNEGAFARLQNGNMGDVVLGNANKPGLKYRLTLGVDGQLRLYSLMPQGKDPPVWQLEAQVLSDICIAGPCGPYAGCHQGEPDSFKCECMRGFRFSSKWGCDPWKLSSSCLSDTFIDDAQFAFGDDKVADLPFKTIDRNECLQACRTRCNNINNNDESSCAAVSYDVVKGMCVIIRSIGSARFVDGVASNASTTSTTTYSVRIAALPPPPPPNPPPPPPAKKSVSNVGPIVGGISGGILGFLLVLAFGLYCALRRHEGYYLKGIINSGGKQGPSSDDFFMPGPGAAIFNYELLKEVTNGFSDESRLGQGGFGTVYKGTLHDGSTVAIKALSETSKQGDREFMAEASLLSRLQHPNLARLRGWCSRGQRRMLVYEFMSGGSLDRILFNTRKPPVPFAVRWHIIIDVAQGLTFMHEQWEQVVVHRDVKTSNILLDERHHARLGDFGLARSGGRDKGYVSTEYAAGTHGYAPPEYQMGFQASPKWDVFSFGVVALELASGRRAVDVSRRPQDEVSLRLHAWALHKLGRVVDLADPRLMGTYPPQRMLKLLYIGLLCTAHDPSHRPEMSTVLGYLQDDRPIRPPNPNLVSPFPDELAHTIQRHIPTSNNNNGGNNAGGDTGGGGGGSSNNNNSNNHHRDTSGSPGAASGHDDNNNNNNNMDTSGSLSNEYNTSGRLEIPNRRPPPGSSSSR